MTKGLIQKFEGSSDRVIVLSINVVCLLISQVTGQAEEIMYSIMKGIRTKPSPGDKNYQKWLSWWTDQWSWRGLRELADNSLGVPSHLYFIRNESERISMHMI